MQAWAEWFYKSKEWQDCRNAFYKSRGGLCEDCLRRGLIVPGEAVHHKTFITKDNINNPAITLNPDNLELLCRDCHANRHKGKRRYNVDALGRVTAVE